MAEHNNNIYFTHESAVWKGFDHSTSDQPGHTEDGKRNYQKFLSLTVLELLLAKCWQKLQSACGWNLCTWVEELQRGLEVTEILLPLFHTLIPSKVKDS